MFKDFHSIFSSVLLKFNNLKLTNWNFVEI